MATLDRSSDRARGAPEAPIEICFHSFSAFLDSYASKISLGGLFLESPSPRPAGSRVDFEIRLDDGYRLVRGSGKVEWVLPRGLGPDRPAGMGLRFEALDESSRELILKILEEHVKIGGQPFDVDEVPADAVVSAASSEPEAAADPEEIGFDAPWGAELPAVPDPALEELFAEEEEDDATGDLEPPSPAPPPAAASVPTVAVDPFDRDVISSAEEALQEIEAAAEREPTGRLDLLDVVAPAAAEEPVSGVSPDVSPDVSSDVSSDDVPTPRAAAAEAQAAPSPEAAETVARVSPATVPAAALREDVGSALPEDVGGAAFSTSAPVEESLDEPTARARPAASPRRHRLALAASLLLIAAAVAWWARDPLTRAFGAAVPNADPAIATASPPPAATAVEPLVPIPPPPPAETPPAVPIQRDGAEDDAEVDSPAAAPALFEPARPGETSLEEIVAPATVPPAERESSSSPAARQVTEITLERRPGATLLTLRLDGILDEDRARYDRLSWSPQREQLSLLGIAGPYRDSSIRVDTPELTRVRTGYHPGPAGGELRLVFDLPAESSGMSELRRLDDRLEILFSTRR